MTLNWSLQFGYIECLHFYDLKLDGYILVRYMNPCKFFLCLLLLLSGVLLSFILFFSETAGFTLILHSLLIYLYLSIIPSTYLLSLEFSLDYSTGIRVYSVCTVFNYLREIRKQNTFIHSVQ